MSQTKVRFYFSFRSPYAWIAAERIEAELAAINVEVEPVPIFPTPELFPNDPSSLKAKGAFLVQDVRRLARDYSLRVQFPRVPDCDWSLSHAAALAAIRRGQWLPLTLALFRQRFAEGADLGDDSVLARAAEAAGTAPSQVLADAHSEDLQAEVSRGWRQAGEQDGVFGVPSFVFAGKLYWGQDRMHHLKAAVQRKGAPTD